MVVRRVTCQLWKQLSFTWLAVCNRKCLTLRWHCCLLWQRQHFGSFVGLCMETLSFARLQDVSYFLCENLNVNQVSMQWILWLLWALNGVSEYTKTCHLKTKISVATQGHADLPTGWSPIFKLLFSFSMVKMQDSMVLGSIVHWKRLAAGLPLESGERMGNVAQCCRQDDATGGPPPQTSLVG